MAALLTSCVAGAYAQTAEQKAKQLPPLKKKELDLKYLRTSPSPDNDITSRYLQKRKDAAVNQKKTEKQKATMPLMQPDSSMQFYILAAVPDSTVFFYLQVKKPD